MIRSTLPYPQEVIKAVANWCGYDFSVDVTMADVDRYRRSALFRSGTDEEEEEFEGEDHTLVECVQ